ncbi:MAG: molecular chaperone HtpG [Lachnospiraceae bacterium]|uniref:Molecular chaperone HtpG n=1 Tax=Candidatus Weimeria bifida TaxID=2599074 RepID=A0A6N7IYQ5_9FIRM|nr:molecular chaperone HtpG [Candidatus Weimeria bifida]RRF97237.1 MAG: molecular chaperone HtpG [Lachnospiraceae bacterium]
MAEKSGSLSITSENIFPVIKKWLYSDHDIFYRELISNACDAITKLEKLGMMGDCELPSDYKGKVTVEVDPDKKTIKITDNGIGMTEDEVDKYINQIAFSGATDFLEKYKDKGSDDQIIGHFGLGFYSAFMVADLVYIDSLSYQKDAKPVHWECDGGTDYTMRDGDKDSVGTTITLFLNDDCLEFANEYRAREVLDKYCSFMPTEIYLVKANAPEEYEEIDPKDKKDTDKVIEEIHQEAQYEDKKKDDGTTEKVLKTPAKDKLKIVKRPVPINDIHPLWTKTPSQCTEDEYKDFYRKVFNDYREPLFWIHLNMDYPFNLKGIIYFPKINSEYDSIEGTIKLYNNQVFVADNIKEVIPEYFMLLKGVIDCPDLPLNVSRSALQNDGFVAKIRDYISKKVADKLIGMEKTEKETYEKYWDDISPFIKYGCLKDVKFCDKMNDYILFKDINDKYVTLPELLEKDAASHKSDDEKSDDKSENKDETKTDTNNGEIKDEDKTPVYYVTDVKMQGQYIDMFKANNMDAVILDRTIDTSFITQLEQRNQHYKFLRIDADVSKALSEDTDPKELEDDQKTLADIFKKELNNDDVTVKLEKLKADDIAAVIGREENMRRMSDMMKMYNFNDGSKDDFTGPETLVLNANHPLVKYLAANKDSENAGLIAHQLYDLAEISNQPLPPKEMSEFVKRSNKIMEIIAK